LGANCSHHPKISYANPKRCPSFPGPLSLSTDNGRPTKGQSLYLETLVQLVQAYEASQHEIETADISGLDTLRHLLIENEMNASDLARLLGVHTSMGSKILNGDRSLTVDHLKKLSARFGVRPDLFIA